MAANGTNCTNRSRLQECAKRLCDLLEESLDVVYQRNIETDRYDFISPSIERVTGFTENEVADMTIEEVMSRVHPEDVGALQSRLDAAVKEGRGLLEYRFRHKDGSWRWLADHMVVRKDQQGNPLCRSGVVRDVTERKRFEDELRERELFLSKVIGSSLNGLYVYDTALARITFINDEYTRLTGYRLGDLHMPGNDFLLFFHPDDRQSILDHVQGIGSMADGETREIEYRFRRADGAWIWCLSRETVFERDEKGRVTRYVGSFLDITDRKRMENSLREAIEDLERSNRDLQQFAYIASHDLQEPLRTVSSFVGLLKKRYEDKLDDRADEYMTFAQQGVDRMQELIKGLLDYSRAGRSTNEKFSDTKAVLRSVLEGARTQIQESGCRITVDELPATRVDPVQLGQLFQNLLGNAIKFRKPGEAPQVHVSARRTDECRRGDCHVFSISDNGIGFDPEFAERIFMIFQRLHTRTEYPGTGIGLAICKKIVERYGGRIWVESQQGKGSTFHFILPTFREAA